MVGGGWWRSRHDSQPAIHHPFMADDIQTPERPDDGAVTFIGFVLSLAHTAAVHFGDIPDPMTGQPA
jgi:hypothetical protein